MPAESTSEELHSWVDRFRKDLELIDDLDPGLLAQPGGVAVSGGPDSMALMWLMFKAKHGGFRVASVDHGLRAESAQEVLKVAAEAQALGVAHDILTVDWPNGSPKASLQDEARKARYRVLELWAAEHGLGWIMTAHHADDQAETMVMRLVRGSGLAGLSGIRRMRRSGPVMLVRPLLDWRRTELDALCARVGIGISRDPSNEDARHDRTRTRQLLSQPGMPDPQGMVETAGRLAGAEEALQWACAEVLRTRCNWPGGNCRFDAAGLPDELVRRTLVAILGRMGDEVRGQAAHRAMVALRRGETVSLGHAQLRPGETWLVRKIDAESSPIGA